MRLAAAVALLLLAPNALAQRLGGPGGITRVPGYSGWPRVPSGPVSLGMITAERPGTGLPFHGPIPLPPGDRVWMRLETPHFVIISSAGERRTRAIAEDFEKLTALLTNSSPLFRAGTHPTQVFVFGEHRDAQPYIDGVRGMRINATGITFRHPDGTTMLLDSGTRGGDTITPRHELIHDLLRRAERPLPLWIEEGLAEYYSNAGMPIREHASLMRAGLRMPYPALFAMRSEGLRSPKVFDDFYAQSWATVATLMRRDKRAFYAFVNDVDHGMSEVEALQRHYRMSLRELEVAIRPAGAPAPTLLFHSAEASFRATPIRRAQAWAELGAFLARVKGREHDADRHFQAAIADEPQNSAIHLAYAEVLMARAECAQDARVMANRALAYEGDPIRAHAVIALSYLAQQDAGSARPHLERAFDARPDRLDLAFPLFTLCIESGEREKADAIFIALADTPKATDARKLLLRVDIPRADALAREGKLLEAARVLRDLAPKMPAKTRTNLETQAAGLEAAARSQ